MISRKNLVVSFFLLFVFFGATGFNRGRDPSKANCLDCHDDMKVALRKKYVHYPFEAGQCDACHNADTFGFVEEGTTRCTVCHRDFAAETGENIVHAPVKEDCLTCHNPHASDYPKMLADRVPALCFTCHESMPVEKRPLSVHAPFEEGECLTCHNPHISPNRALLLDKSRNLCSKCHDVADAAFNKTHINLLKADSECASCHRGHFSPNRKLIIENAHPPFAEGMCDSCHVISETPGEIKLEAVGAQLCTPCHADIETSLKSKFAHLPAGENCLNCHGPHATTNPSLLIETGASLCARCHGESIKPAEGDHLHPPFSDGKCTECHNPHGSDNQGILANAEKDTCLKCHQPIAKLLETNHPHTAAQQGCVACHKPHMAKDKALLKEEGEALCFRCHESRQKQINRFVHYPYREGNCSVCHMPHSGAGDANLTMESARLCALCHPKGHKEFPHPTGVKASSTFEVPPNNKLNFTRESEVGCTTCHTPHSGDIVFLLRAGVIGGELCYECHIR
ncbi:hypothetical protein HZA56_17615 [Candidatus Poribacteria bacterium]|nr:hypothetical protein [Candidatus Poribacteria bacterium]